MIKERIWHILGFKRLNYNERLSRIVLFLVLSLLCVALASAQNDNLDTEVVDVVKPYAPSVSDAFKIKETPVLLDSTNRSKRPVSYRISSVPVASTFTPAKGKAADIENPEPETLYDNYALLGFGSYTSVLAEMFSNFQINRTDNAGFFVRHHSSQGGIDGVRLDNNFYDTRLEGRYNSLQKDMTYGLEAGIGHRLFNWYGLPPFFTDQSELPQNDLDVTQQYTGGFVKGQLWMQDGLFKGGKAGIRLLTDRFGSSEINMRLQPEFEFPVTDLSLSVSGDLDWLTGAFDQAYGDTDKISYGYFNTGIKPSLVFVDDRLSLSLGVAAYLSLDMEKSDSRFYLYPNINASYGLLEELLVVYGGLEGGLDQNSYDALSRENPFVSPTLTIRPTSRVYEAFGGIKGKLSEMVAYNLRGSYGRQDNMALFRLNPVLQSAPSGSYRYGNSFGVVYDQVNTLAIFGELKLELSRSFNLGARATYFSYDTQSEDQAWNLPSAEASIYADFYITQALYGRVDLLFTGSRKDLLAGGGQGVGVTFAQEQTLDAFLDANIELGYRLNPQLTLFVKGNNLVAGNYERWLNYPVLGLQVIAGASYQFDW